ncbi:ROK family protein [Devosia sp. RR2S18]|uniref:ROK family protein n=1 Tax=Devosia rhizosphaerae TaxID=3049774 RepID=UPI0025422035|nr:ROK family protein [Devosia sp. RR2S18]WIJ27014.1 ROK family protein [Devosia sp. RR2S18]
MANSLIANGNVEATDTAVATGVGRPANRLALIPEHSYVLGLHFGVGRVGAVLTDCLLNVRARGNHILDLEATTIEDVLALAVIAAKGLIETSGVPRGKIKGIGVGVPGRVDPSGRNGLNAFFSKGQLGFPFADVLEEQLGLPVLLSHNVTAMAMAETLYGAGKGAGTLLNIYMRRGIGAGLMQNGAGGAFRSSAVELGHVRVQEDGQPCHCGRSGCLETILSEQPLLEMLQTKSIPSDGLLRAAMAKETEWSGIYSSLVDVLATATTLLEPDLILLSGHLGEAPPALLDDLRRDLPSRVMPQLRPMKIERAVLQPDAGALGAACVGLEQFVYRG